MSAMWLQTSLLLGLAKSAPPPWTRRQKSLSFCRLHWDALEGGHFEQLQGPEASVLPNGLAWDQASFYHADTAHRTITEYQADPAGVPLRPIPGQSIRGRVVLRVPESDGAF